MIEKEDGVHLDGIWYNETIRVKSIMASPLPNSDYTKLNLVYENERIRGHDETTFSSFFIVRHSPTHNFGQQ